MTGRHSRLTIGSLFSGIGGLELGLERAGLGPVVWQVEKDEYCRAVLAKHWPDATRYEDVKDVGRANLAPVDVLCGGFPCQDISYAGKGAGLKGERSGLWFEYARIVREMEPRYVVVENVSALLTRGLDDVLGTLADLGYDAEWSCVRAFDVGAPHLRDRIFIVANAPGDLRRAPGDARSSASNGRRASVADTGHGRVAEWSRSPRREAGERSAEWRESRERREDVADATRELLDGCGDARSRRRAESTNSREVMGNSDIAPAHSHAAQGGPRRAVGESSGWTTEPDVGRVAHGVPSRVDRLRALGNAVVPQVAEVVGEVIMELERQRCAA